MSGDWNPVEGLEEIKRGDIREGDIIVVGEPEVGGSAGFRKMEVKDVGTVGTAGILSLTATGGTTWTVPVSCKIYLLERAKMKEPSNIGSMVWIEFQDVKYIFIRLDISPCNPWKAFQYADSGYIFPVEVFGDDWHIWNRVVFYNPQPYEWGQIL